MRKLTPSKVSLAIVCAGLNGTKLRQSIKGLSNLNLEIVAWLDNSKDKIGTMIDGLPVVKPDQWSSLDCDYFLITLENNAGLIKQLSSLGIALDKLIAPDALLFQSNMAARIYQRIFFERLQGDLSALSVAKGRVGELAVDILASSAMKLEALFDSFDKPELYTFLAEENDLGDYARRYCRWLAGVLSESPPPEKIRIHLHHTTILGHLAIDYCYALKYGKPDILDIGLSPSEVVNSFLVTEFNSKQPQNFHIVCDDLLYLAAYRLLKNDSFRDLLAPYLMEPPSHGHHFGKRGNAFIAKTYSQPRLTLKQRNVHFLDTEKDRLDADSLLKSMGLDHGIESKYICFNVRTDDYMREKFVKENKPVSKLDNHIGRSSDIRDCVKALSYLIEEENYTVIRIGSADRKTLPIISDKCIDYALDYRHLQSEPNRSDLLLVKFADFFFQSSHSGIIWLAELTERPVLTVNCAPIIPPVSGVFIPKKIARHDDATPIGYHHIYDGLFDDSDSGKRPLIETMGKQFGQRGFQYVDNTEEEIYEATRDFVNFYLKNEPWNPKQQLLIGQQLKLIPEGHWARERQTVMAPSFIKSNSALF